MRSSRSTHAILSLPHKYRVPLRHKRSLGYAQDDDTRERFPHIPFHTSAIPTSAPSGHLLPWEGGRMPLPHEEDLRHENTAFPVSSFRAKREIFLAHRSNGERQLKSSRSTHAILSLPHKYRVPLRRKRSLGSARDDDTRDRFPHILFHTSAIPTSAPSGHLLPWEGGRMPLPHEEDLRHENTAFPHIVISSKARNLPCTPVKRRASDEEQPKHLGDFYHYLISIEYRYDVKDPSAPLGMTKREAGYLTRLFIRPRRRLPLRGRSILRLRRAPSSRGYTTVM